MPGGLEAIAMVALQELKGSNTNTTTSGSSSSCTTGNRIDSSLPAVTEQDDDHDDDDHHDKSKDPDIFMSVVQPPPQQQQQQSSRLGPSSPAVVSSTSQEEHDDNQKQEQEEEEEENSSSLSSHAPRVVSFESMNPPPNSDVSLSMATTTTSTADVADQVLAVLQAAKVDKDVVGDDHDHVDDFKETMERILLNHLLSQKEKEKASSTSTTTSSPMMNTVVTKKRPSEVAKKNLQVKKTSFEGQENNPTSYFTTTTLSSDAVAAATITTTTSREDHPTTTVVQGDSETEAFISKILADPQNFLLSMEPQFSSSLNKTIDTKTVITDGVRPNDVLCGRGGETNHHTGNIQYRKLVKAYRGLYVQSTRRIKPKVAQCIVYSIRQMGGRFLKRVESSGTNNNNKNNNTSTITGAGGKDLDDCSTSNSTSSANNITNNNNGWWVDVGNIKAREKTSQALREGAPDLRSVPVTGTTPRQHQESPHSPIVDVVSKSSGLESSSTTSPSLAVISGSSTSSSLSSSSSSALAGYSTVLPSHVASNSGNINLYPANPSMGHDHTKLPISGSQSLTNHPLFHTLSPYQKHQIMMEEMQAAREAAAAAEFAALRNYHYHHQQQQQQQQRGLHDPFGHGVNHQLQQPGQQQQQGHMPPSGYKETLGSALMGGKGGSSPNSLLQERMQMQMNSNQQQHYAWNVGNAVGLQHRSWNENQRKRNAQAASPSLPESVKDNNNNNEDDDDKVNSPCRGPRLKRLKQRRQLEA